MKKIILILVSIMIFCCSAAADGLYTFADIPADTPYEQLKEALEAATHLPFTDTGTSFTTAPEPPIKYLDMPVYAVMGGKDTEHEAGWIDVILKPYEVDLYADQTWKLFDDGNYLQLRKNIQERYGVSGRMYVFFVSKDRQDVYRIENRAELMFIVEDAANWMMRNGYEGAKIEIYRKNACETYIFTNASDPAVYGNTGVAFVYPGMQFYSYDAESTLDLQTYMSIQAFPVLKGVIHYRNNF